MKLKLARNTPSGVRSKYILSLGAFLLAFSAVVTLQQQTERARLAHETSTDNIDSASTLNVEAQDKASLTSKDQETGQPVQETAPKNPETQDNDQEAEAVTGRLVSSSENIVCQLGKVCDFTLKTEDGKSLESLLLDEAISAAGIKVSIVRQPAETTEEEWKITVTAEGLEPGVYKLAFIGSISQDSEKDYAAVLNMQLAAKTEQPTQNPADN